MELMRGTVSVHEWERAWASESMLVHRWETLSTEESCRSSSLGLLTNKMRNRIAYYYCM